jgi:hypothetical protein
MLKSVSSITNALGALNYKGTWNASSNTPTLADGTGTKGDYYVVSTGGTQTFGGVQLFFGAGDWIAYNGAVWQRVEGGADGNFANVTVNNAVTAASYDTASATAKVSIAGTTVSGAGSDTNVPVILDPKGTSNVVIPNSSSNAYGHFNGGNTAANGSEPWLGSFNNIDASAALFGWAFYNNDVNGDLNLYRRANSTTGIPVMDFARSSGIITMGAYGAGAATFSAAGVISSVSDETWKIKDGVPTDPDAMLKKLEPGYWFYNNEKKDTFGKDRQLGFYAQNVHEAIGEEAAPTPETYLSNDENGNEITATKPWGYYDRSVLAVAVMSLKNALSTIEELQQRITVLENK